MPSCTRSSCSKRSWPRREPGRGGSRQGLRRAADAPAARRTWRPYRPSAWRWLLARSSDTRRCELAPPYLTKIVIDQYIPAGDLSGLASDRRGVSRHPGRVFHARVSADMDAADDRAANHVRPSDAGASATSSGSICASTTGTRSGRLMTRVTTDVDVLNELFTSGVVSVFGDRVHARGHHGVLLWLDWRLALVAFSVLPLIAHRHPVVPDERPRVVPERFAPGLRASTRSCRSASPG